MKRSPLDNLLMLAALLAIAQPTFAMNKCISRDNKVTYTDTICPLGEKTVKVEIVSPPVSDLKQAQEMNARLNKAADDLAPKTPPTPPKEWYAQGATGANGAPADGASADDGRARGYKPPPTKDTPSKDAPSKDAPAKPTPPPRTPPGPPPSSNAESPSNSGR